MCNKHKNDDEKFRDEFNNPVRYSFKTRVGFWFDEMCANEEQNKIVAYKANNCMLLMQKIKKLLRNLQRPTTLAVYSQFVMYGQNYLIKATDIPIPAYLESSCICLAGLTTEKELEENQNLAHGCSLVGSPKKEPCVRNTFQIVHTDLDIDKSGHQVAFGRDVYLRSVDDSGVPLYVQCENSTVNSFGKEASLRLTQSPDLYCRFKFFHWDLKYRGLTEGSGFAPNSRVVLLHSASGKNMVVDYSNWIPTLFGNECQILCAIRKDGHRNELQENYWKIVGTPTSDTVLYVRAAKGENIPAEDFN